MIGYVVTRSVDETAQTAADIEACGAEIINIDSCGMGPPSSSSAFPSVFHGYASKCIYFRIHELQKHCFDKIKLLLNNSGKTYNIHIGIEELNGVWQKPNPEDNEEGGPCESYRKYEEACSTANKLYDLHVEACKKREVDPLGRLLIHNP